MILDNMTKLEVMHSLRTDFDKEVLPYYEKLRPKIRLLIENKSKREKRIINLGWEEFKTSNGVTFKILKRGDAYGDKPQFIVEFLWNHKHCYASILKNQSVVVYQKHCLDRYIERILKCGEIDINKVLYNHILKNENTTFVITLPSPTHQYSSYFVQGDALFLGDYEDVDGKYKSSNYIWLNTCISLKDAHYTQKGIIGSLSRMQNCLLDINYNPLDNKDKYMLDRNNLCKFKKDALIEFFKDYFMLYQLQGTFQMPFAKFFEDDINDDITFLKEQLRFLEVAPEGLSPFGEKYGFAIKGELDYRI